MKAIFSKTGNKKEVSGKMDRRTVVVNSGVSGNSNNHQTLSPNNGRAVNSFIPTAGTYHGHINGHAGKQISQSHQMSNNNSGQQQQQHVLPNHFYSNTPGNPGSVLSRQDHHYINSNYQQQSIHHNQQQRTLTKSYSNQNQQSHYGNTTLYASNNNNVNHNHGSFYGNTANLGNGAIIMNGHNHAGEKTLINGHHSTDMMGQIQNSYNHEQVVHHQQNQTQTIIKKNLPQQQQHQHVQIQRIQSQQNFQQAVNNGISPNNATEGLPTTLVESMRTLFDILDDSKQGKIRLSDIETRWENDSNNGVNGKSTGAEPLIKMGVLQYLRQVTPTDGLLTFDRFCSGLRLALLTTNNSNTNGDHSIDNINIKMQSMERSQRQANPPQQFFQEQIRNMANTASKPIQHNPPPPPPQQSTFNGASNKASLSAINTGQSNTIHRFSKIPNFSTSRLPMPNSSISSTSGIPLSPTSTTRANNSNTIPMSNNKPTASHIHNNNTLLPSSKRYPTNSEQGTTIAMVHPQPPPNPKPIGNNQGLYSTLGNNNAMKGKSQQNSGFLHRFASRNSSLDDLQSSNNNEQVQTISNLGSKERPPSAPILDEDNSKTNEIQPSSNKLIKNRERAKSQERDRAANNNGHHHLSRAEEKANFAKSRQRTLSMPQLQLSKMKPKSGVNFEDNSPTSGGEKSSPESYPKPSALKNGGHGAFTKLLAAGHQYGSSIPSITTIASSSANNNTLKHGKMNEEQNNNNNSLRVVEKDPSNNPPPPPKPPRNAMNGPVTISTTLINGLTQEPPLSGSSFESGQSSSATISVSTISSGGGNNALVVKPEIKSVLNSWQKNMTDKKPIKQSLSTTIVGSSANTNERKNIPLATIIMNGVSKITNGSNNGTLNSTSDDVKLRQPTKSSLKRKDTARRHTVQSGIDFSTLKRLKQLEQERDVLQQGLVYLEKANEWYQKQLEASNEKICLLNKGAPTSEYWSESNEERLNLLGCRITELNSLLTALMDGSSQLPAHMNLQIPSHLSLRTMIRLKDQNKQLTQEVSDYSHRVTQLENEKGLLLRQLFHQKNNSTSDETIYM